MATPPPPPLLTPGPRPATPHLTSAVPSSPLLDVATFSDALQAMSSPRPLPPCSPPFKIAPSSTMSSTRTQRPINSNPTLLIWPAMRPPCSFFPALWAISFRSAPCSLNLPTPSSQTPAHTSSAGKRTPAPTLAQPTKLNSQTQGSRRPRLPERRPRHPHPPLQLPPPYPPRHPTPRHP